MTQEEKSLLLIDLSSRLLYGVKILIVYQDNEWDDLKMSAVEDLETIDIDDKDYYINDIKVCNVSDIKPYLRPMSSMTEEEKKELKKLFDAEEVTPDSICFLEGGTLEEYVSQVGYSFCTELIDWLNAHHFDYRGLIERKLAIAITKEGNLYK